MPHPRPDVVPVPTPVGPARVRVHRAGSAPRATLVLGHGAGGGVDARDLAALAAGLPSDGVQVVLVEQPWRVAGRPVAGPPGRLDEAWAAVLGFLSGGGIDGVAPSAGPLPVVVGGRSAGARVACRNAEAVGASAVLALAFPLHPPGRPDRSRVAELLAVRVPLLVVQGDRDPFGSPGELPAGVAVHAVAGADHGFAVARSGGRSQEEVLGDVVGAARSFVLALPLGKKRRSGAR